MVVVSSPRDLESANMQQTQEPQHPPAHLTKSKTPWWSPRDLTPGYFALVMASGIVSIACHLLDYPMISLVLLCVAAIAYITLILLNSWRVIAHSDAIAADFADVQRSFGFFTLVAGTAVL